MLAKEQYKLSKFLNVTAIVVFARAFDFHYMPEIRTRTQPYFKSSFFVEPGNPLNQNSTPPFFPQHDLARTICSGYPVAFNLLTPLLSQVYKHIVITSLLCPQVEAGHRTNTSEFICIYKYSKPSSRFRRIERAKCICRASSPPQV